MKKLIKTLLFSGLILLSTGLSATNRYQVELVVFSQISPHGINQEAWSQTNLTPLNLKNTLTLIQPDSIDLTTQNNTTALLEDTPPTNEAPPPEFTLLPESSWNLTQSAQRLDNQAQYEVLLHLTWQQTINNTKHPQLIHLYGGHAYNYSGHTVNIDTSQMSAYSRYPQWQVNGTLKLSLDRYINEDFNLRFSMPSNTFLSANARTDDDLTYHGSFITIPLTQTRRTRSGELNYIDHPLFGILSKVTPVKTKKETSSHESAIA